MGTESIIFNLNDDDKLIDSVLSNESFKYNSIIKGSAYIQVFGDGETCVNFEDSVRGKRVYLLTSPDSSIKIMQLMLAIDAAKRSSALEIIPIVPYFPYARQDKRDQYRGPIGARVLAKMLEVNGATSIVTFDLHANQIEGFFDIPIIHIRGKYLFAEYLVDNSDSNTVFCSPDAGGVKRVKKIRDLISERHGVTIPYVTIDKTRSGPGKVSKMTIIGDVKGKDVTIIDDLCDSGRTLIKATNALLEGGALSVKVLVTHAVMSGNSEEMINDSKITEFICSDTLDYFTNDVVYEKFTVISIDIEIAKTIIGINVNGNVKSAR